jgi:hypothetical protein
MERSSADQRGPRSRWSRRLRSLPGAIGFQQLANRIYHALDPALPESHSKVQLLAFLSRGTGWGINDLEGVTAPPSLTDQFREEIAQRRRIREGPLELQRAGEMGDLRSRAAATVALAAGEEAAFKTDHELGLRRCSPVLPPRVWSAIGVI